MSILIGVRRTNMPTYIRSILGENILSLLRTDVGAVPGTLPAPPTLPAIPPAHPTLPALPALPAIPPAHPTLTARGLPKSIHSTIRVRNSDISTSRVNGMYY